MAKDKDKEKADAAPAADPKAEAEAILAEAREFKAQAEAEVAHMRSEVETARLAIEKSLADLSERERIVSAREADLEAKRAEAEKFIGEKVAEFQAKLDEREAAAAALEGSDLSGEPNCRELCEGTVVYLNGRPVALAEDAFVRAAGLHRDDAFAALLAADPDGNFERNAGSLRLLYSPLSGVLLSLGEQALSIDEMTDGERALFAAPERRAGKQ